MSFADTVGPHPRLVKLLGITGTAAGSASARIEGAGAQPREILSSQGWDARHYRIIDISRQTLPLSII
jgi:hypothetical protein